MSADELAREFKHDPEQARKTYIDSGENRNPGKVMVKVHGVVAKVQGNDVHLKTEQGLPAVVLQAKSLPENRTKAALGGPAFVTSYDGKTILIQTEVTFQPYAEGT